jgi:hypothetical protein
MNNLVSESQDFSIANSCCERCWSSSYKIRTFHIVASKYRGR